MSNLIDNIKEEGFCEPLENKQENEPPQQEQLLIQEQVNAMVESAKHPENAVRFELTHKVSDKLKNDEQVKVN